MVGIGKVVRVEPLNVKYPEFYEILDHSASLMDHVRVACFGVVLILPSLVTK